MNLILTALTFSLAITGLYVSFQWPGMILRPVKERLDAVLPAIISKPLYDCPICMSSFWTLTFGARLQSPPDRIHALFLQSVYSLHRSGCGPGHEGGKDGWV